MASFYAKKKDTKMVRADVKMSKLRELPLMDRLWIGNRLRLDFSWCKTFMQISQLKLKQLD